MSGWRERVAGGIISVIPKRFRVTQVIYYSSILVVFPATMWATRSLWCGKVMDEETLRQQYSYTHEVRDINRARLQELLDKAKQGKPGGHEAGEKWDSVPVFHGPWDVPTRAGEPPKPMNTPGGIEAGRTEHARPALKLGGHGGRGMCPLARGTLQAHEPAW
eukprot:CAMPEP_0180132040 /NCGR_PEP_ID=MMETSP0986-20121125/8760_1 /TAXON_ID=697907 /ORGANISM="non described non described, Strain CCMP2293" /LENGTH=161 /DNA_ID=CAMNT_0022071995 /DNA_START=11 /DNA_END=497 /DNA_ORIENTATION=+